MIYIYDIADRSVRGTMNIYFVGTFFFVFFLEYKYITFYKCCVENCLLYSPATGIRYRRIIFHWTFPLQQTELWRLQSCAFRLFMKIKMLIEEIAIIEGRNRIIEGSTGDRFGVKQVAKDDSRLVGAPFSLTFECLVTTWRKCHVSFCATFFFDRHHAKSTRSSAWFKDLQVDVENQQRAS